MAAASQITSIIEAILSQLKPGPCTPSSLHLLSLNLTDRIQIEVSDEALQGLRHLFSDNLILGALTLIDNEYGKLQTLVTMAILNHLPVTCYILGNGRRHYIVQGSHATSYTIHLNSTSGRPPLCSCYAFIHSVLAMRTHIFVCLVLFQGMKSLI
jgi:hypothetical protein